MATLKFKNSTLGPLVMNVPDERVLETLEALNKLTANSDIEVVL